MHLLDSCGCWPQMLNSRAHCCTCAGRLKALQPGLKAAFNRSSLELTSRCLRSSENQRGQPAVAEAVRHRCSHIAATKADQVFDVIFSQGRLRDVHLHCGSLTCTATDARKLLLTQLFTCIAAMSLPNHISRTVCGVTNAGGVGGGWHNAPAPRLGSIPLC